MCFLPLAVIDPEGVKLAINFNSVVFPYCPCQKNTANSCSGILRLKFLTASVENLFKKFLDYFYDEKNYYWF